MKIFADDTKAYINVDSKEGQAKLQRTIDNFVDRTDTWLVKFNADKCKMLHLGKNNPKYEYTIIENGVKTRLTETTCEKDLGIMINPHLNFDEHITGAVK